MPAIAPTALSTPTSHLADTAIATTPQPPPMPDTTNTPSLPSPTDTTTVTASHLPKMAESHETAQSPHSRSTTTAKPFRFLDLPAKMRNRIYDETITHRRIEGRVGNTALLRVCKQIHSEAKGIFDANSTFSITVQAKSSADQHDHITADNNGRDALFRVTGDLPLEHSYHTALDTFYDKFPETLRGAPDIQISLPEPTANDERQQMWTFQCFMFGLVGFLHTAPSVSDQCIQIILPDFKASARISADPTYFQQIAMFSFAKLPPYCRVIFLNSSMCNQFDKLREKAASILSFDTMAEYTRLRTGISRLTTYEYGFEQDTAIQMHESVKRQVALIELIFETDSMVWIMLQVEKALRSSLQICKRLAASLGERDSG